MSDMQVSMVLFDALYALIALNAVALGYLVHRARRLRRAEQAALRAVRHYNDLVVSVQRHPSKPRHVRALP